MFEQMNIGQDRKSVFKRLINLKRTDLMTEQVRRVMSKADQGLIVMIRE